MTLSIYVLNQKLYVTKEAHRKGQEQEWTQTVVQNSLTAQFADHYFFGRYKQASSIALIGAPYIGKSLIINKIIEIRNNYKLEEKTKIHFDFIYNLLDKNHERWGVSTKNWHHLVWVLDELIRKLMLAPIIMNDYLEALYIDDICRASKEDKKLAKETIRSLRPHFLHHLKMTEPPDRMHLLMKTVFEQSCVGKNTIFESDEPIPDFCPKSVHKIFIYCPLSEYINRVDKSYRKIISIVGNLIPIEIGMGPLIQYASLVRVKSDDEESVELGQVTPKLISECFAKYFTNCLALLAQHAPHKVRDFEQTNKAQELMTLKAFGFNSDSPRDKEVELVPRDPYDYVINTKNHDLYIKFIIEPIAREILNCVPKSTQAPLRGSRIKY